MMSVSADPRLAARIAWYHFQEGLTQSVIAEKVGLSRARVNQIIGELRASGAVQLRINTPHGACVEMEAALKERFGLAEVIVVPAPAPETDVRRVTGMAAGHFLSETIGDDDVVGVGWGGTIDAAASAITRKNGRRNTIVSFCGGFPRSTPVNPYDVAARFARILQGPCYYVTAPMFADDKGMRDALASSSSVRETFDQVRKVDVALVSAVDLTPRSRSVEYGLVSEELRQSLLAAGAVGDICGHYLTADGDTIAHEVTDRIVAPPMDDLLAIPHLVLASGGEAKVPVILAALRRGLAHTLIVDENAASELMVISREKDHPVE